MEDSFPLSSLSHLHFQSTSLLSILSCRLIYQQKREENGDIEKQSASLTEKDSSLIGEQDANQSSSVEPTWGQWRQKTEQELSDEWKAWEETNQSQSTQAYRHGRYQPSN